MEKYTGLRTFVQVVDTGSFSSTARLMGVAPSSVSRQINELEAELSVQLFQRTTRKLSLTEAGQVFHERVAKIILDLDEARLAVSQLGSPSGVLRISVPSGIGRELVASNLPAFLARYPGIRVVLSMTDELVDTVEDRLDVAIRMGQLSDSTLRARKIVESRRLVCASPEYLDKAGEPKTPGDLAGHNCLTWRAHPGHNVWKFRHKKRTHEVRVTGDFFARSADALIAAAAAGLGLVLLPDLMIGHELRQKLLRPVLTHYQTVPGNTALWAVHSHGRQVPP
ncbi:MAG: LysR family transcriptional regulator [Gammaproteobacteria bacterium]|nr:LysR family transcriptional regulator [Gammaproteobacteria bacterium]